MLGKLMKHEWKETYRLFGAGLLFMLAMTVLTGVGFGTSPLIKNAFGNGRVTGIGMLDVMWILSLIMYVITLIGLAWGSLIYLAVHFYKSMYSDQGYLTHTLPVTSHQLLISKILISGIWYLIIGVSMAVSGCILVTIIAGMALKGTDVTVSWRMFREFFDQMFPGTNWFAQIILYVIQIIIGSFCSLIVLFGAITLGQLFSKHKVMMSFVCYFGINILESIVASLMAIPLGIVTSRRIVESQGVSMNFNLSTEPLQMMPTLLSAAFAVTLYFVSNYIIKRKLNLD